MFEKATLPTLTLSHIDMTGFDMTKIACQRVDLYSWDWNDWTYDPHFDVVFVLENSPIETYLTLLLG
jgi:hypothetical protein